MIALETVRKAYFIGIGGIGMSAIARYLNSQGVEIHGYDLTSTDLTTQLSKEGMRIHFEEDVTQIPDGIDLVVYTPAVPARHQEMIYLKEQGHQLYKRAAILGMISKSRNTIAVAGTHGKTTTTSIMTQLFKGSTVDPSAFLGGINVNLGSNYYQGNSDWVIAEADEYDRSFHQLFPKIAVVLAADPDHLDIYGTEENMVDAYLQFLNQVDQGGTILLNQKVADKPAF
ncbi:MAG: Mur ligase domain-containing protein, partial [Bacteroidota bacterium]